jgi:flagellar biosynthesis protein FliQ
MSETDALDIVQAAIWTILLASGPAVAAAMIAGLTVALFQALTQVQEVTLTFIPKIVAILAVAAFTAPFMGQVIYAFAQEVFGRIEHGF